MKFTERISHSSFFAAGAGARNLRRIAVCVALAAAAAGLAQFSLRLTTVGQPPALRGEAAIRQLKTDGGYASLAAAMAAARYQIYAAPAKSAKTGQPGAPFYANNPGQRLRATFASDEVRVNATSNKPDGDTSGKTDSAELQLRLAGYGYGEQLEALGKGVLTAQGDRIAIAKSAIGAQSEPQSAITEWYVNKPEGLEQGFTLAAPPAPRQVGEWLCVALTVGAPGSGWSARVRADGQGAVFERRADGLQIGYDHLAAYDAQGRTLPSRMSLGSAGAGDTLALLVDDAQAVYPLTIDPILTQQRKLTASDGAASDFFGESVALSGNTAIIGAPFDDVVGVDQGSAYVFVRNGTSWSQQQKIIAPNTSAGDRFGSSVAIDGDTVVVGAPNHDNGPNVDQGIALVFVRSGATWTGQITLISPDGMAGERFGTAVAISGETAVVGAPDHGNGANANQGAAYVFTRRFGVEWSEEQKLVANDGAADDLFGGSIALDGDTVVVGASNDDIGANADQGSAYVFTRTDRLWTQQKKLTADDGAAGDFFGLSVALSGDTIVASAFADDIGANANQGSVYVFTRNGATWTKQQKLTAAAGAANDSFGRSVALSGDTALVGAAGDNIGTTSDQGSAYIFTRSGGVWTQQQKLFTNDGAAIDNFGFSVALNGDTALVGAPFADIGGNRDQGAAYVFVICANNLVQQQQLTANDGATGDNFGVSVAVSGDTAVVGAEGDDIGSNMNQGSAYVFTRSGGGWAIQQKLTVADGAADDGFGASVAISGDTVVVGAEFAAIGANRDEGAAYVFVRNGATWTLQQKLPANLGGAGDIIGHSVAISGDTVVVGAPLDFVNPNLNQPEGSAHVFVRSGGTWTDQQKLLANDGGGGDQFGDSVAISGDTILVGASTDDIGANGNQGSAYVFTRVGTVWTQQQKLTANDGAANDFFGRSVALSDDTALVGAPFEKIGMNLSQGAAYSFTRSGTVWTQQQKLTASDGATNDSFGASIAISGDTTVVGAELDTVGANQFQGSAYVFTRSAATWAQQQKLTPNNGTANDHFGHSVAVSGDTVVVGAHLDDPGSAYVFVCPACPLITLNPANLPGGLVGKSYNQTVTASGGAGPYQFSLSAGALPPGLALAQNGQLSGAPTTAGSYRFTITATILSSLCPGSRSYTLTVSGTSCPTVTLNPSALPAGRSGAAYSQQLSGSGGAAPYSFALSAGALPNGMSLSTAGLLSGPPTAFGVFNFTVRATDANGCQGTRAYSLTITAPCATITVNPNTLPGGAVGVAYSQTITATGGASPYTFTVSAGALPADLSLSPSGALSGAPTTSGAFNITIRATDANGCQGTRAYSLTIASAVCNFSVAPASYAFPPDGGSGLVNVNAAGGCAWTAASNDPFITITSGANGSGNGTVKFEVSINPNPGSRRGTLNIAGRNVTVVQSAPVACVSAASFALNGLASESIVAAFGIGLAKSTEVATTQPLPTTLAGTRVSVLDSQGTERLAALFFTSSAQINFQVPPGVAVGKALVTILRDEETVAASEVEINSVAPGLFSADSSGQGVVIGVAVRVKADGTQSFESIVRFDEEKKQFVAAPIDVEPETDQVFLAVFATGLRNRSGLGAVSVKIGGVSADALYAGPQGAFAGLDQINVLLPRGLMGRGEVELNVVVDGKQANALKIAIK